MTLSKFKVRCAPSPSGSSIHLGNLKTFLFNYLFSKKYNADFLLRIEDTDQSRVVKGGAEQILEDLKWVGISPTVGFGVDSQTNKNYCQSNRLDTYKYYAHKLIEQGLAYKCYCSEEELDKQRTEALEKNPKIPFKYPGVCRNINQNLDKPYVIRFKSPLTGNIEFNDIAFGKRTIPNKENYDFVILRQNGFPLYNFAVVIDDAIIDQVTHVIRGSDHLKNMPQQILLYTALGLQLPVYCHLPMILSQGGAKLSKRDGSVSVTEWKNAGYAPQAILNYLVRFGWGFKNQEIFSLNELIEKFNINDCGRNDGKFDPKKFATVQFEHMKNETLLPNKEYVRLVVPFLQQKNINPDLKYLENIIYVVRNKAKTFLEAANLLVPFFIDPQISSELKEQFIVNKKDLLFKLNRELQQTNHWNLFSLKEITNNFIHQHNTTLKDIGPSIRVALTGSTITPELFQMMEAMGKEKVIARLQ